MSVLLFLHRLLFYVFDSLQVFLPEITDSPILRDLLHSFRIEQPVIPNRAPPWDLALVLSYLKSSDFQPLESASLRSLTIKAIFLVSLATAKRVGELHPYRRMCLFLGKMPICPSFLSFGLRPNPRLIPFQVL